MFIVQDFVCLLSKEKEEHFHCKLFLHVDLNQDNHCEDINFAACTMILVTDYYHQSSEKNTIIFYHRSFQLQPPIDTEINWSDVTTV
uniref:Uncharacterized protein n=1 Tax=Schistosoma haematobium TaxID=6185 RepID=A0A094ZQH7_SCHHA